MATKRALATIREKFPEYEKQCLLEACARPHVEWINYKRHAESWEADTQGYAVVTRLHPEDRETLMWRALNA